MTIRTVAEHGQSACHRFRKVGKPTASIAVIVDWAQLLPSHDSFAELESACRLFCCQVNARPHPVTRRAPAEMQAEEAARLHPLPEYLYTAAFRVTRAVPVYPDDRVRERPVEPTQESPMGVR